MQKNEEKFRGMQRNENYKRGADVVEMGQIKVFVQELGLKQWFQIPIREKSVSVCIVLVHWGPFPQEIYGKSVMLAVSAVSLNFLFDFILFVIDIHQIMLISLFPTPFDHFHFHMSGGLILWYDLRL